MTVKIAKLKPYLRQKGATLIMTAFLLPVLFAALGGALDLGNLYVYKSQLQNVADSAALAGVAYQGSQSGIITRRLVDPSASEMVEKKEDGAIVYNEDGSIAYKETFTITLDKTTYNFEQTENTGGFDTKAAEYVDLNTSDDRKLSLSELKAEDENTTMRWSDTATSSQCYLVKLRNTIPTYFIRYFGIDELSVEATAVAMAYIEGDNTKEIIEETAKKIAETVPNYYWETIVGNSFTVTNMDASTKTVTIGSSEEDQMTINIRTSGYGYKKAAYYTDSWGNYIKNITTFDKFSDDIIAYKDRDYINGPYTKNNELCIDYSETEGLISDPFCAEPIYVDDEGKESMSYLQNLVYTLDADLIKKGDSGTKEITGLFLDRPNIGASDTSKYVRGTVLNITSAKLSQDNATPLYMRFESEPIKFGGSPTFAQPITINVNGYQEKPMIIAYDGPDPKRTLKDVPKTDVKKPETAWAHDEERILSTERLTTAAVSPPYTIYLGADFNGVIYAPFSEITITGPGKINGYVLAARIRDKGTSTTRTQLTSSEVSLPRWETTHTGGNSFAYTIGYVKSTYSIVYDGNGLNYAMNIINIST